MNNELVKSRIPVPKLVPKLRTSTFSFEDDRLGKKSRLVKSHSMEKKNVFDRIPLGTDPTTKPYVLLTPKDSRKCVSTNATPKTPKTYEIKGPNFLDDKKAKTPGVPQTIHKPNSHFQPVKKRPVWDLKGRLQDVEEERDKLKTTISNFTSQVQDLTKDLDDYKSKYSDLGEKNEELRKTIFEITSKLEESINNLNRYEKMIDQINEENCKKLDNLKHEHNMEMSKLNEDLRHLNSKYESIKQELETESANNNSLKVSLSESSTQIATMKSETMSIKSQLDIAQRCISERDNSIEHLKSELALAIKAAEDFREKLCYEESIRRKLHNTIQELRGNIRVFCRVRPLLTSETQNDTDIDISKYISIQKDDDRVIEILQPMEKNSIKGKPNVKLYPFSFDKVFSPESSQENVFEEMSQITQSALDGYNVSIFAYGQTGSGKTFTMEGPPDKEWNETNMGMIPRTVRQIFKTAELLREKSWEYLMEVQYIEIYNENIRDLLSEKLEDKKKHEIKHDIQNSTTYVTDVKVVPVKSPDEVYNLLAKASQNRSFGATKSNEQSSRSHSIFILSISGKNTATKEHCRSVLNLVDLAGSERLSSSGSTGERLKETQAINKSLSCLGDVIFALSNKDSHIPYRNTKLTYYLQGSLGKLAFVVLVICFILKKMSGGNSKTLMLLNISPHPKNFQETLCSLRFAKKVNLCQIGTAKRVANIPSRGFASHSLNTDIQQLFP